MAVYYAISGSNYEQTADNNSIPQSIIPEDAHQNGKSYALSRDATGDILAVDSSDIDMPKAHTARITAEGWALVSGSYQYDVVDARVTGTSWVNAMPFDVEDAEVVKRYLKQRLTTYDGGFTLYSGFSPDTGFNISYTVYKEEA